MNKTEIEISGKWPHQRSRVSERLMGTAGGPTDGMRTTVYLQERLACAGTQNWYHTIFYTRAVKENNNV